MDDHLLFLSADDVAACGISPGEVNALIEAILRAKAQGGALNGPSMTIALPGGDRFVAKGGVAGSPAVAALKWFAIKPGFRATGVQNHRPLLLLIAVESGAPVAVMEASWITAARTAAISAVAARHMARNDARSIGFVGCGTQARSHLAALRAVFPIERIVGFSRRRETAAQFCDEARNAGIAADMAEDPQDSVAGMDIVVTSVPPDSEPNGFLDGRWVRPGTFVAMVDRGFSWQPAAFEAFDRIVTDDLALSGPGGAERLAFRGDLAGDLEQIVTGKVPGRRSEDERNAIAFSGMGLADAAVAAEVYRRAHLKRLGTLLRL